MAESNIDESQLVSAINVCAVSLLRYSEGVICWTQAELQKLDVTTRKLFTMHGGLCMNSDVDRLYVPRKKGGRGLISAALAIEGEWRNLSHYVHHSEDPYVKLVAETFKSFELVGKDYKQSILIHHLQS